MLNILVKPLVKIVKKYLGEFNLEELITEEANKEIRGIK